MRSHFVVLDFEDMYQKDEFLEYLNRHRDNMPWNVHEGTRKLKHKITWNTVEITETHESGG